MTQNANNNYAYVDGDIICANSTDTDDCDLYFKSNLKG